MIWRAPSDNCSNLLPSSRRGGGGDIQERQREFGRHSFPARLAFTSPQKITEDSGGLVDEWREAVSGPTPLQTSHLSISRPLECMGRVMEGRSVIGPLGHTGPHGLTSSIIEVGRSRHTHRTARCGDQIRCAAGRTRCRPSIARAGPRPVPVDLRPRRGRCPRGLIFVEPAPR